MKTETFRLLFQKKIFRSDRGFVASYEWVERDWLAIPAFLSIVGFVALAFIVLR